MAAAAELIVCKVGQATPNNTELCGTDPFVEQQLV